MSKSAGHAQADTNYNYNIIVLKCQFRTGPRSGEMEKPMKQKFVQIAALSLSVVLFLACGGRQSASAAPSGTSSGRMIRVGLHFDGDYSTGPMEGLNLANETGSGFRFGYYDGSSRFTALGSTGETAISVVKTMNVYYGTYNGYASYHSALTSSGVAVGEYHLQLPGTYETFGEARDAALAADDEDGFPAYIDGEYFARIGNYTTRERAEAAQAALGAQGVETEVKGTSAYGVSVVVTGTNTIVFQFDDLGEGIGLGVEPSAAADGVENGENGEENTGEISVKYTTWSQNNLYYGGFRFERIRGGSMTVVNILDLEDYVRGVVPHEMSDSWPIEALKAQAVAARSYALSLGARHSGGHFDICDNTHCQAYSGLTRAGSNSDAAVEQTAGQIALYNNKAAQTFYYSSNGGASESSSVVWGSNQASYPYLLGKEDPYEATLSLNNSYTKTISATALAAGLKKQGYNTVGSSIVSVDIISLTDAGNPRQVTFTDNNGKKFTLDTRYVKDMLGLSSYRYGIVTSETSVPGVSINGDPPVGAAGLYAIDGDGNVVSMTGDVYVLTGSGTIQLGQDQSISTGGGIGSLGSATASSGSFTFVGKGWGHNVGMSQWGAYAMARQGYTYLDILQFYYTGITVGFM